MIKRISLESDPFHVVNIDVSKINMMVGINGGGKSYFLKTLSIQHDFTDQSNIERDFTKYYSIRFDNEQNKELQVWKRKLSSESNEFDPITTTISSSLGHKNLRIVYINESNNISLDVNSSSKNYHNSPFSAIEWKELHDDINELLQLFGRKILLKYNGADNKTPYYEKKTNLKKIIIPAGDDGFGILNHIQILTLLKTIDCDILCVEELCSYLHPSIIPDILKQIIQICLKRNIQLFFTSHNPVVVCEFVKLYYNENDDNCYSIHKCEINQNKIYVSDLHFGNLQNSLSDFFLDYPTEEDKTIMDDLKRRHKS